MPFKITLLLGGTGTSAAPVAIQSGTLVVGLFLGIPSALVVRHLRGDEPMQAEAIGMIIICGGIALWIQVSFLLCIMMMDAVIANMAKDDDGPLEVIEHFE